MITLGVPPMVQVEDRVIPVGRVGDEVQEAMTPPVFVALMSVSAVPTVPMKD